MATRKTYTQDFKLDAVKLVTERGLSRARVARDLGIGTQTLRNWLRAFAGDNAAPPAGTDAQQLAALRRENELLREERDILKKALGIFSRVPRS
jgi:transposase